MTFASHSPSRAIGPAAAAGGGPQAVPGPGHDQPSYCGNSLETECGVSERAVTQTVTATQSPPGPPGRPRGPLPDRAQPGPGSSKFISVAVPGMGMADQIFVLIKQSILSR